MPYRVECRPVQRPRRRHRSASLLVPKLRGERRRIKRLDDPVASMRSFVIGGVIALAMLWPSQAVAPANASTSCAPGATSRRVPPATIRVWVPHLHRIWRPSMREYVLRVMSAGAAPAHLPEASLQAMALAITQYAWFEALHPSEEKRKPHAGGCFDIKNGGTTGQYVWPYSGLKPYTKKQEQAVDSIWGWTLWKRRAGGQWFFRPGWRDGYGGACRSGADRWHLPEDEATACAKAGWDWKRIVSFYYGPVVLKRPSS
jgi:hypothetical protein